jgi:prepilin-type N-terminal cleavage/methylation domain-containing protein
MVNSLYNTKKHNKGFTLIELLVVLTILVIVVAIGYQFFTFGSDTFERGEMRYIAQENVLFASDLITRELRYANDVTILDKLPDTLNENSRYIYISGGVLKHYTGKGVLIDALGSINNDAQFTQLDFSLGMFPDDSVSFKLAATSGTNVFSSESEVQIINLPEGKTIDTSALTAAGLSFGPVISYTYAESEKKLLEFGFLKDYNPTLVDSNIIYDPANNFSCFLPSDIDLSKLVPYFKYIGKSITLNGNLQYSNTAPVDFTNPVIYTITADDGSTVDYKVTVVKYSVPPSAAGVKIDVLNDDGSITPYENSTLQGVYEYIANGCGPEGASQFLWQYSDTEDFLNPIDFATTKNVIPTGRSGQFVRFGVKPVSSSGIPSATYYFSSPKRIYPPIDDNPFWRSFINDTYTLGLPNDQWPEGFTPTVLFRTKYKAASNLDPNSQDLNLTMSYDHTAPGISDGGSHIYKDVRDYVTDTESYSITIDAQVMAGSGYGVLLYGTLKNNSSSDLNVDSGYMFQFDPGWNGFLIRKIENGQHNPCYRTFGVIKNATSLNDSNDQNTHQARGVYTPQDIRNNLFRWNTDSTSQDISQWRERYKTEITLQRQLDNSIIFRVAIIDEDNNRSNEMWFGDFTQYNMQLYKKNGDEGGSIPIRPRNLPQFTPYSGTMFGLRTWDKDNAGFKTLFQEIKLGEGFSMNIQEAEFISPTQIKVSFDQKIRDVVNRNMITVQGHNVSAASVVTNSDSGEQALIITLSGAVNNNILKNGISKGLSIQRGAVKHEMAGDVKITNGGGFDIKKDTTPPQIDSISRNNNNKTIRITFNEPLDPTSILDKTSFIISRNGNNGYNPDNIVLSGNSKELTLHLTSDGSFNQKNRITIRNVQDISGNTMEPVINRSF